MLKDKTILFIVHKYNSFQKDPIEEAAKYFKKVYVLVRYKPFSSIIKFIPIRWLKVFDESYVIDLKGLPKNVQVIKTPVWYLPFGIFYKLLGELHFRAVCKAIKKYRIKFDIVHCHFLWSSGYVGMKLKERYKVPFVVTGHGYDVYSLPFRNNYWRKKIRDILDSADQILTVSNFNKEKIEKIGIDKNKIKVVYNGFSSKMFYPEDKEKSRTKLNIPLNKRIILSVGNLEKVKGFDILVDSLSLFMKDFLDVICYVVGGGSQYSVLRSKVKEAGLENRIDFVGLRPHSQIRGWMNSCDVFVIPSRIESASVVLLEAMACGKPIVGTNVGILPEVITSSNLGYLCRIDDKKTLSENIQKALDKKWNSDKITRESSRFSWENSVSKIAEVYKNLLEE